MKKPVNCLLCLALVLIAGNVQAQNVEMADTFRSEGKIYVVVAIVLIILTGLISYLFLLDRKLNKLEDIIRGHKKTK
jgi:K+-transporting ATPase A subunit